jgi:hypothetical protein
VRTLRGFTLRVAGPKEGSEPYAGGRAR